MNERTFNDTPEIDYLVSDKGVCMRISIKFAMFENCLTNISKYTFLNRSC